MSDFGHRRGVWVPSMSLAAPRIADFFGVAIAIAILFPRSTFLSLIFIAFVGAVANVRHAIPIRRWFIVEPITLSSLTLAFLAIVSWLWAPEAAAPVVKGGLLALVVLLANLSITAFPRVSHTDRNAIVNGFVVAMVLVGAILAMEAVSERWLERALFNSMPNINPTNTKHMRFTDGRLTWIDDAQANRRNCVFFILLLPAFGAAASLKAFTRSGALLLLGFEAAILAVFTQHQSSQLAVVAAMACYALIRLVPMWTRSLITVAWVAAVLFMVPATYLAFKGGVHHSDSLFPSARQRIVIWGYTAERIAERPILGVGADATAVINTRQLSTHQVERPEGFVYPLSTANHAHNYYVQVWYELGLVGALVFLGFGICVLLAISRMSLYYQHIGFPQLAAIAAMVSSSYGLWQFWVHGVIAVSMCLLAMLQAAEFRATIPDRAKDEI
jgi:O-antigen ligase